MNDQNVTVIEDDGDTRRVEQTREVWFDSGDDIVWLQAGDEIRSDPDTTHERILEIGDGLSESGGVHARTQPSHGDEERIVHLNIIRGMLDRDGAYAVGERTSRHTQVEGTDY